MYNPKKQYRCAIIRARAISEADDLLPKYATVIDNICPCTKDDFENRFNQGFREYAESRARSPENEEAIKKTLDNHRTEISGKLFGMHYEIDGMVYASERTKKFLQDNDQPAFFKDWLIKMQFPNGMQKSHTYLEKIADGIRCHPYSVMFKVLEYAKREGITLLKSEIGYYMLNSEDVLKGNATPNEVFDEIMNDKRAGLPPREIEIPEGENRTKYYQHITDQLQYLQLANLIIINGQEVSLNPNEMKAINAFIDMWHKPLGFDAYKYDLSDKQGRKQFEQDWAVYYGKLSKQNALLDTSVNALVDVKDEIEQELHTKAKNKVNKVELGDEGEEFVYEYERARVGAFNQRLVNKVLALGKQKGLGYDIQSVIAEPGDMSEFVKYIEVKSTKRVTAPDINDNTWLDTVNITRNEWVAAQQHREFYSIYRVYFVRGGIVMYVLNDIDKKKKDGLIDVVPLTYRIDFQSDAVDKEIKEMNKDV